MTNKQPKPKNGQLVPGTMVFWGGAKPWWIIEWQANNGPGCYWLTDATGFAGCANDEDLSFTPIPDASSPNYQHRANLLLRAFARLDAKMIEAIGDGKLRIEVVPT